MQSLVACFSGGIASGKTSVTRELASQLGWKRTTFSDFLRSQLAAGGNQNPTREQLQDLGKTLVELDPDRFTRDVLSNGGFESGKDFILDGIRHLDIYHRVRDIVQPAATCLLHLAADRDVLRKRAQRRGDVSSDLNRAMAHEVERELQANLPDVADYVIDASQSFNNVVLECRRVISDFAAGRMV